MLPPDQASSANRAVVSHSSAELNAALLDFEQSQKLGVWTYLDKSQLIREVRSRVSNPFRVNQGQQPFCGPASIVFELIRKQPLRYIQNCRSLFETGQFQGYSRTIQASEKLRQTSIGQLRMAHADWMMLSTLRESENLIFPVDPNAPQIIQNLGGMTKSWEMAGWVEEILGYSTVEYHHAYLIRDLKVLQKGVEAIAQGGVTFLLITANGLLRDQPINTKQESRIVKPLALPDHWITLLDDVTIQPGLRWNPDSGHVGFNTFSWAANLRVDVPKGVFRRFFWSLVLGKP
jgi:hypothetical protein